VGSRGSTSVEGYEAFPPKGREESPQSQLRRIDSGFERKFQPRDSMHRSLVASSGSIFSAITDSAALALSDVKELTKKEPVVRETSEASHHDDWIDISVFRNEGEN